VGCREEFLSKKVPVVLWLFLFKGGEVLEVGFLLKGSLGSFWTEPARSVCQTGLTDFPCLCEAKSNRSSLTSFRNRPDRFGLPAAVLCVLPLRESRGCWLGLAPRSISTPVAAWTWQEKLVEVHE
jgi:hypothetical protein